MNDAETLAAVRDFIRDHEHKDDWGVPCVYTNRLRIVLGMEVSPL